MEWKKVRVELKHSASTIRSLHLVYGLGKHSCPAKSTTHRQVHASRILNQRKTHPGKPPKYNGKLMVRWMADGKSTCKVDKTPQMCRKSNGATNHGTAARFQPRQQCDISSVSRGGQACFTQREFSCHSLSYLQLCTSLIFAAVYVIRWIRQHIAQWTLHCRNEYSVLGSHLPDNCYHTFMLSIEKKIELQNYSIPLLILNVQVQITASNLTQLTSRFSVFYERQICQSYPNRLLQPCF